MKRTRALLTAALPFLAAALLLSVPASECNAAPQGPAFGAVQTLPATVQSVAGKEVTLACRAPEWKSSADPVERIVQDIARKTLFLEGMPIVIGEEKGTIRRVAGNTVGIVLEKPAALKTGAGLVIDLPKKKVAVAEIEVLRGNIREAGSILAEKLGTAFVEAGSFVVVERQKIQAVMEEMKLASSGLTEIPAHARSRLLVADLIVTGTMTEMRDAWEVHLRAINVATGQAVVAVQGMVPLFRVEAGREAKALEEDFESYSPGSVDYSWRMGPWRKGMGNTVLDTTGGAGGSKKSLRLDYNFTLPFKGPGCPSLSNVRKRDLSLFKGIEFMARSSQSSRAYVNIDISDRDDPRMRDRWSARYPVGEQWRTVRVPFDQLSIIVVKGIEAAGFRHGRQVRDLGRVEAIRIGVCPSDLDGRADKKGSLWIDKLRFY